ncbi:unnamed protein product [Boreogadus saida]
MECTANIHQWEPESVQRVTLIGAMGNTCGVEDEEDEGAARKDYARRRGTHPRPLNGRKTQSGTHGTTPGHSWTATEQTDPPGEAESSPLTEFLDFFPDEGGRNGSTRTLRQRPAAG